MVAGWFTRFSGRFARFGGWVRSVQQAGSPGSAGGFAELARRSGTRRQEKFTPALRRTFGTFTRERPQFSINGKPVIWANNPYGSNDLHTLIWGFGIPCPIFSAQIQCP